MLVAAAAADAFVGGAEEGGTRGTVGAPVSMGVPGAPSGPPPPPLPPPTGTEAFKVPPTEPLAVAPPPPGPLLPGPAPTPPGAPTPAAPPLPPLASLDVTVVELTCRLPEDLRPLDEPPTKRDLLKRKKNKKTTKNQQIYFKQQKGVLKTLRGIACEAHQRLIRTRRECSDEQSYQKNDRTRSIIVIIIFYIFVIGKRKINKNSQIR